MLNIREPHAHLECVCVVSITIPAVSDEHKALDFLYIDIALLMCSIQNTVGVYREKSLDLLPPN